MIAIGIGIAGISIFTRRVIVFFIGNICLKQLILFILFYLFLFNDDWA